jgi:hypothetical protein
MYELVSTSQFKYYNYKVIISHELIINWLIISTMFMK